MHQTIVKVEPFKEPGIYNFGLLIPDMNVARDFYPNRLGFVVRSEKYLPKDLQLGHKDNSLLASCCIPDRASMQSRVISHKRCLTTPSCSRPTICQEFSTQ